MKFLEAQRAAKAQKDTGENKMLTGSLADRTENKSQRPARTHDPRAKRLDQTGIQKDPPVSTLRAEKSRATPGATQLAEALGVNLDTVKGTGSDGQIVTADVRKAHAEQRPDPSSESGSSETERETDTTEE